GQAGPVDRVDGDVARGALTGPDRLAVVEHRGLVLLALADHDDAVHRDRVDHQAHRVDGGLIGCHLVAAAHPSARGERGGLGDPDELQGDVAVRTLFLHAILSIRAVFRAVLRLVLWGPVAHPTCATAARARAGPGRVPRTIPTGAGASSPPARSAGRAPGRPSSRRTGDRAAASERPRGTGSRRDGATSRRAPG